MIDYEFIAQAEAVEKCDWQPSSVHNVIRSLGLIKSEAPDGTRYWKLSDKVVPLVPHRMFTPAKAAKG